MVIDAHFHVDTNMLSLEEMVRGMDRSGITKAALITRVNEAMLNPGTFGQQVSQNLFRFMLKNAYPFSIKLYNSKVDGNSCNIYGGSCSILDTPDNHSVADAINRYPDRFWGWVTINPLLPQAMEEVETFLAMPGFIGVKAHPFMHQYSIKALHEIAGYCSERGIPMLIHLSSEAESYKYLPETFPKLKLIYAHAGIPFWSELPSYIQEQPNVYVDLSSDYIDDALLRQVVREIGAQKCLYGSDGPYGMHRKNEYDYSARKSWVEDLAVPDCEKDWILSENFLALIDK